MSVLPDDPNVVLLEDARVYQIEGGMMYLDKPTRVSGEFRITGGSGAYLILMCEAEDGTIEHYGAAYAPWVSQTVKH